MSARLLDSAHGFIDQKILNAAQIGSLNGIIILIPCLPMRNQLNPIAIILIH